MKSKEVTWDFMKSRYHFFLFTGNFEYLPTFNLVTVSNLVTGNEDLCADFDEY